MTNNLTKKLLAGLILLLCPAIGSAVEYQGLETIRDAAQRFALTQIENDKLSDIKAVAGQLDPRLQLKQCEKALEAFASGHSNNIARSSIGIRCTGQSPWTIYVPVSISAKADVIHTSRPHTRGEVLQADGLQVRKISIERLPLNYLDNIEQLVGMELTRALRADTILTLNAVKYRQIVQQGQEVIIIARGRGVQVRMTGKALRNGSLGDSIPVKNVNSGRTIEATVLNESTVAVNM